MWHIQGIDLFCKEEEDAVTLVYVLDDLKLYLTLSGDASRAYESFDVNVFGSYLLCNLRGIEILCPVILRPNLCNLVHKQ